MINQRFTPNKEWYQERANPQFMGFTHLMSTLLDNFNDDEGKKMIEIGAYMGESTFLFGCSGLFSEIHTIDPHDGEEEFNELFGYDWDFVKNEFKINIRHFDNIIHYPHCSYNIVDDFDDNGYDFLYVDGSHTYEDVKRDFEMYLPKIKSTGFVGGHDYIPEEWPGVVRAVNEIVGEPDTICWDTSWIKKIEEITIG